MNKTVKYTSEYVYNIIKLDKTRKIVEDILQNYEQNYGASYHRIIKVTCVFKFLDKITNETKSITNEIYNIIEELNKIMQSSGGLYKLNKKNEIRIIITE